ncbi:hypothetical protein MAR_038106 [Mya arenaria]|uniref:CABIT domain-containing protein n=1 Tax=Mya arenaria TaxID=6604 RepID=A0ABY7FS75_MYAAR|nr:uncharacterized protein LOC128213139 [Mya arenaria]WAR24437.1 hypothetical protein MAR_038106 [Mya arenaria]
MAANNFHPVNIPKPETNLIWSDRSLNLIDLLKEIQLPAVVKMNADEKSVAAGGGGGGLRKDASAMLKQPMLLFQESKGFKVVARNVSSLVAVKTSRDGVQYKEGGSVIVLPVDYPGWFRILEEDTVPILNMATLARVMPASFLSTRRIPGFSLLDPLNRKDIMYEKLEFPPGVFTLHSVFEDYVKYTGEKNAVKRKLLRCVVCVTSDGLDVLVPFDVQGEFYVVEHKKPMSKSVKADKNSCAYTLKQLVAMGVFTRPLVLKLLIGEPPSKPCGFTGVMKVFDIIKDWTVIAQTLDGKRKLLELPVLPFPEFIPSTNGKDLLESGTLRAELSHLRSGAADKYAKEVKVRTSFNLKGQEQSSENDDKTKQLAPLTDKKALPMFDRKL